MKPVLGLDFGTTNTTAAWVDENGLVEVVDVDEDGAALPSVVAFLEAGSVLVGDPAKALLGERPASTFYGLKRLLGRRFRSDYVARYGSHFAFELLEGSEGEVCLALDDARVALDDVLVHIVQRIAELSEVAAGHRFEECVVTVPAHYTFRQRQVTRRIVERVMKVRAMINEPTAAALYLMQDDDAARRVLVYDLGGGTFDVTLLDVANGAARVLATGGDAFLGGNDFDQAVTRYLVERFQAKTGIDPTSNTVAVHRIRLAAEAAKLELSHGKEAQIKIIGLWMTDDGEFVDLEDTLTRDRLEEVTAPLIERTLGITEEVMAQVKGARVDELLCVGGQTRMPVIQQRLQRALGVKANRSPQADLAVALGAALHGAGKHKLDDVTSVPIHLAVPGTSPRELIPGSCRLPTRQVTTIKERPARGSDLNLLLYEAVEVTSTERDVIGSLAVPWDWLASVEGPFDLEAVVSAGQQLRFAATAPGVAAFAIQLKDLGAPKELEVKAGKAPVLPAPRGAQRFALAEPIGLRTHLNGTFSPCQASDISESGLFLETTDQLQVGKAVQLQLKTPEGTVRLTARVVRRSPEAESDPSSADLGAGKVGVAVAFSGNSVADLDRLQSLLTSLQDKEEGSSLAEELFGDLKEPAGHKPGAQKLSVTNAEEHVQMITALRKFLKAVRSDELYEALGVSQTEPSPQVVDRVDHLRNVVETLRDRVGADVKPKLALAERLLGRTRDLFSDPMNRLVYDFKHNHVHAHQRLKAAQGDPDELARLRRAWILTHPGEAAEAQSLVITMKRAVKAEDKRTAFESGMRALRLDPFNLRLKAYLDEWG